MLAKLIIILIIIVIFILLFLNFKKKEGFQATTHTTSSVEFNTQCYNTELTNCVGNCNIVEDIERTKCVENNSCSSLSESNCNEGCSFKTNIKSNCEGKNKANCLDDICVWNTSQNKCFEKNSNYEKDENVIYRWSQKCNVDWNEYQENHPDILQLKESQDYKKSNYKDKMVENKQKELFKNSCENKEGCLYKKPGEWGYGECVPDHPCRRYTTEDSCVNDRDNECVANIEYDYEDNKDKFKNCEPAKNMFEKITGYSGWDNKKAGRINGKKVEGEREKLLPKDCGKNGNPENFVYEGPGPWSRNYCYSDYRLCENKDEWLEKKKPDASEDELSDYSYAKLFNEKCFSMKATPNHTNLFKYDNDYNQNTYYPHSLLRDSSKIKYFSCEEIKKIYLYSKMVLKTSVDSKCVNLPNSFDILVGSSDKNVKTVTVENLQCYDIPTELDKDGPTDEKPNKGKFNNYYYPDGFQDTFNITKNESLNQITVKRTDINDEGWDMNLNFTVKKKQNKKITEKDKSTAETFINYVDNMPEEEIDNIFGNSNNKKCLVLKECLNDCINNNERDCRENSKCSWITDNSANNGYCIRNRDITCNRNAANTGSCSGSSCKTETEYNYRFCAPKLSCNANEYLDIDSNGNTICRRCPSGTFLENGICKNCGLNEYSEEGSLECTPKTTCPVDSDFVDIQVRDININIPTDKKEKIKNLSKAIKDITNLKQNRICSNLNKCSLTNNKYVTNYDINVSEAEQQKLFNESEKIYRLDNHLKNQNSNQRCPFTYDNINYYPSETTQSIQQKTRYSDYNCEDLKKCDKNQYIANYDKHKITTNDMYTVNRECADTTNCLEGTYEKDRVSTNYPVFDIEKNGERYKVYTRNRNCLACEENYYSDTPNMTSCVLQPTCAPGNKANVTQEDFINSDIHELIIDSAIIDSFKGFFYYLNPGGTHKMLTDTERKRINFRTLNNDLSSIDLFINTTSSTSGQIKYINDSDNMDVTLFEYRIESNDIKLSSRILTNLNNSMTFYNQNTKQISFSLTISDIPRTITIRMKHSITKKRRLDCANCEEYTYTDEENRLVSCKSQPQCNAGQYYEGDPTNRASMSSCSPCAENTYIDEKSHYNESCIPQPTLQQGECSVNYNSNDTTTRMVSVDADGITNYQNQTNHRAPCLPQPVCGKGQLINEPSTITQRVCNNIEDIIQFEGTPPEDLIYMDEINHRNQFGITNSSSCPSGESLCLNDSTPNAWTYTPYKCDAECQSPNRQMKTSYQQ